MASCGEMEHEGELNHAVPRLRLNGGWVFDGDSDEKNSTIGSDAKVCEEVCDTEEDKNPERQKSQCCNASKRMCNVQYDGSAGNIDDYSRV